MSREAAAGRLAAEFAGIAREAVEGRGGTLLERRATDALRARLDTASDPRGVDMEARFVEETFADSSVSLAVWIGLDAGESAEGEGGNRGDALNLASRMCGQARAGGILG